MSNCIFVTLKNFQDSLQTYFMCTKKNCYWNQKNAIVHIQGYLEKIRHSFFKGYKLQIFYDEEEGRRGVRMTSRILASMKFETALCFKTCHLLLSRLYTAQIAQTLLLETERERKREYEWEKESGERERENWESGGLSICYIWDRKIKTETYEILYRNKKIGELDNLWIRQRTQTYRKMYIRRTES